MSFMIDFRRIPKGNQEHLRLFFKTNILNRYMTNLKNSKFYQGNIKRRLYKENPMSGFVNVFGWSFSPEGYWYWNNIYTVVYERLQK